MKLNEEALDRTKPLGVTEGRYYATDDLLAFLSHLYLC